MSEGGFKFENDLLKHYIRTKAWLPLCEERLKVIRTDSKKGSRAKSSQRRLKYFTFCAIGAIDVLMLDVASVIRRSSSGKFDCVAFFDKNEQDVHETLKNIPGANGFPGDFVQVVLLDDPDGDYAVDANDVLSSQESPSDRLETRHDQRILGQRRDFVKCFPFDVINLDLERFLFPPREPIPGRLIKAMKQVFSWQRRPFTTPHNKSEQYLDGFSLMFTTQIGPPNMSDNYLGELQNRLHDNMVADEDLKGLLTCRAGTDDVDAVRRDNFDVFFKLAMPKVLASTLMEEDWYIDPDRGVEIFEFERKSTDRTYKMLHLVMDVKRHTPPRESRMPGAQSPEAKNGYRTVVRQIFSRTEVVVSEGILDKESLQHSLDLIKARQRLYNHDEQSLAAAINTSDIARLV